VTLLLQQHETSNDADGAPLLASFQTGYYAIAEGDVKAFVDWIWPDLKWALYSTTLQAAGFAFGVSGFGQAQFGQVLPTATVQISFLVADYPGDTPTVYGPYSVTQATEYFYTRFRARLMAVKIQSSDLGSWWRIGNIRYRFAADGKI
jgi:hypothetical protein